MADRGYKFALGEKVRDKVTGLEGVVIGRANHISGCDTFGVQSSVLKDGVPADCKYFDEPRLVSLGMTDLATVDTRTHKTGADTTPTSTRGL